MHLTRFGFNTAVLIWLLPLVGIDLNGNTNAIGAESDYFYYKFLLDGLLCLWAGWQLFRPQTATKAQAQARAADKSDEVVSFDNISAFEYMYCALLALYAAANFFYLHSVNKSATGAMSMGSLVWSILSLVICILACVQFWHLKSGAIVELKKKVVQ